jgi:hypothetical protein
MGNREYLDSICEFLEDDVIRKGSDRQSARTASHEWNPFACARRFLDEIESPENCRNEPVGSRWVFVTIPSGRLAKFATRAGLDDDSFQR